MGIKFKYNPNNYMGDKIFISMIVIIIKRINSEPFKITFRCWKAKIMETERKRLYTQRIKSHPTHHHWCSDLIILLLKPLVCQKVILGDLKPFQLSLSHLWQREAFLQSYSSNQIKKSFLLLIIELTMIPNKEAKWSFNNSIIKMNQTKINKHRQLKWLLNNLHKEQPLNTQKIYFNFKSKQIIVSSRPPKEKRLTVRIY